jgi:outer membrane biosynthesis protein TonB
VDSEDLIKQAADRVRAALDAAQERADEIVREAEQEAQRIRSRAEAEARERLDEVREALGRLEAGLAGGAPAEVTTPEPAPREPEPPKSTEEPRSPEPQREPPPKASNETPNADAGAARLVAMKLALDGTSRAEAREQLAADYEVADLDALLDEVYAKAGR